MQLEPSLANVHMAKAVFKIERRLESDMVDAGGVDGVATLMQVAAHDGDNVPPSLLV